ncbi:MAG: nucleotidyltransferase domain-containing protein [Actinomycetales bacterium]|nr:nucleotidyltransferase domain-containing protein [Actinomycetales bacterium]
MNLTDPSLSWTSSLDGPVLSVLAEYDRPLTVTEIAEKAARGTEVGVRRVIQRLVTQGIVIGIAIGKRSGYRLNRDHVAADGVIRLTGLRRVLWSRMADHIAHWPAKPVLVRVFGSAARGDGDEMSDIDVLFVRPATAKEFQERRSSSQSVTDLLESVALSLGQVGASQWGSSELTQFESDLARLAEDVRTWSGNAMQAVVRSGLEWQREVRTRHATATEIQREGLTLFEQSSLGTTQFGAMVRNVSE